MKEEEKNNIAIYQDANGALNVSVRFAEDDVWLTQVQLAEVYATTRQNIGQHTDNIYNDGELPQDRTIKKFFIVQKEGQRQVNAVYEHTATELIYERVDHEKPYVGMTNLKWNYVTKDDVRIAKNYLSETELQRLNLMVSGFLDFAELQALDEYPMTIKNWIESLDNQIVASRRKLLEGNGAISHEQAMEKAEKEYDEYRRLELSRLKSGYDLFIDETKKLK